MMSWEALAFYYGGNYYDGVTDKIEVIDICRVPDGTLIILGKIVSPTYGNGPSAILYKYTDSNETLSLITSAIRSTFGATRDAAVGEPWSMLFPPTEYKLVYTTTLIIIMNCIIFLNGGSPFNSAAIMSVNLSSGALTVLWESYSSGVYVKWNAYTYNGDFVKTECSASIITNIKQIGTSIKGSFNHAINLPNVVDSVPYKVTGLGGLAEYGGEVTVFLYSNVRYDYFTLNGTSVDLHVANIPEVVMQPYFDPEDPIIFWNKASSGTVLITGMEARSNGTIMPKINSDMIEFFRGGEVYSGVLRVDANIAYNPWDGKGTATYSVEDSEHTKLTSYSEYISDLLEYINKYVRSNFSCLRKGYCKDDLIYRQEAIDSVTLVPDNQALKKNFNSFLAAPLNMITGWEDFVSPTTTPSYAYGIINIQAFTDYKMAFFKNSEDENFGYVRTYYDLFEELDEIDMFSYSAITSPVITKGAELTQTIHILKEDEIWRLDTPVSSRGSFKATSLTFVEDRVLVGGGAEILLTASGYILNQEGVYQAPGYAIVQMPEITYPGDFTGSTSVSKRIIGYSGLSLVKQHSFSEAILHGAIHPWRAVFVGVTSFEDASYNLLENLTTASCEVGLSTYLVSTNGVVYSLDTTSSGWEVATSRPGLISTSMLTSEGDFFLASNNLINIERTTLPSNVWYTANEGLSGIIILDLEDEYYEDR